MNGADKGTFTLVSGSADVVPTPRGVSPNFKGVGQYAAHPYRRVSPEITFFALARRTDGLSAGSTLLGGFGGGEFQLRYSSASTFVMEVYENTYTNSLMSGVISSIPVGTYVTACLTLSFPKLRGVMYASGVRRQGVALEVTPEATFGPFDTMLLGTSFGGESPLILIFNRELSAAEVKSISNNPWQIFAPDTKYLWVPAAVSVTLPTLVRPTSTISAGLWVPTGAATLHETIDEEFHVDADYMSVNAASTVELELAEAAFPGGANQTLAYWASSTQGSTLTVTLKQGATIIMTRTHALTAIDTLYAQTLTAPEIALITAGAISVTLTTS